jgi:hypothetical protein
VRPPLLQSFPFSSTLEEVTLHLLSQAGVFVCSSYGKWVFPPLLWSFPPTHQQAFPLLGGAAAPAFSGRLVYLQFHERFPSPHFGTQGAPPSLLHVFSVVIAYYSVFFSFFLDGGRSVKRAMLIWPRVVCGSTMCCLAHLVVCVFPSFMSAGVWRCWSPPGFSIYHGVEMLCAG